MNPPRPPPRVVKVGGSLLEWPELPRAMERWLAAQPQTIHVLLCGGGKWADAIRQADRNFSLGEEASHWLCIEALTLTAQFLSAIVPAATFVRTLAELRERVDAGNPGVIGFDPREFLQFHEEKLPGTPLPHTWQATSDSIAARLAEVLSADDLILLKSSAPPAADLPALAAAGYVDSHFPVAARNIRRVQCINLRDA